MKKVLVTGSDGFIGSHLTELLVRKGYDVTALTFYNSFNSWGWLDTVPSDVKDNIRVIAGDIRDPHGVDSAVAGNDCVMHLAALIAIPFSYTSPDSYVDTNIKGTLNVLQACKKHGIKRLVHTSTSEVYGTAKSVPISEQHPLQGQSPYSASKIGADQLANSFYTSFGLPVITIRPFNTYGPRQSARAVLPTIISQIASGARKLSLGSLSPTRDFNYIEDTIHGFLSAMLSSDDCVGNVFNIGSNFEISIGESAQLIADLMDAKVEICEDPMRIRPLNSEVERLWADNTLAKMNLNWKPQFSGREGFRRGLSKTIEWFTEPSNLRQYKTNIYNV